MKRSDKPTEFMLLKAYTSSEWDKCDFAIVHVTESWKKTMAARLGGVVCFKDDDSFSHLLYSECPEGFYTHTEETDGCLLDGENWCFVDMTAEELENLPKPENELCGYQVCIYGTGKAMYKAYAQQNNDECYTDDFDIATLVAS